MAGRITKIALIGGALLWALSRLRAAPVQDQQQNAVERPLGSFPIDSVVDVIPDAPETLAEGKELEMLIREQAVVANVPGAPYIAGVNLPIETDWVTRSQNYTNSGGQVVVTDLGNGWIEYTWHGFDIEGTNRFYIGSLGWQYILDGLGVGIPIWSGLIRGSKTISVGARYNIMLVGRYKTNP